MGGESSIFFKIFVSEFDLPIGSSDLLNQLKYWETTYKNPISCFFFLCNTKRFQVDSLFFKLLLSMKLNFQIYMKGKKKKNCWRKFGAIKPLNFFYDILKQVHNALIFFFFVFQKYIYMRHAAYRLCLCNFYLMGSTCMISKLSSISSLFFFLDGMVLSKIKRYINEAWIHKIFDFFFSFSYYIY